MSDNGYEKDYGPIDRMREASGIYEMGFERDSFMGFVLPFVIVIAIGLPLGLLIWLWL